MAGGGKGDGAGLKDSSDPWRLVKGDWGDTKSLPQKVVSYGMAPNRLRPFAGAMNAAVFNTIRRTRGQILYWGVPMLIAYSAMQWATERNEYLNSKAGSRALGEE